MILAGNIAAKFSKGEGLDSKMKLTVAGFEEISATAFVKKFQKTY